MKTLIGGAIGAVLGIIGVSIWFIEFLQLLAGAIPITLLLGGGLALYLGFDEVKDSWRKKDTATSNAPNVEDVEKYKQEIDDLKNEIDTLKTKET